MRLPQRSFPICQLQTIPKMSGRFADLGPMSFQRRAKFWLKRNLNARTKRRLKRIADTLRNRFLSKVERNDRKAEMTTPGSNATTRSTVSSVSASGLKSGDTVRVRSRAAIEATLNSWKELKGCAVMPDMWQYCETTQRVFKVVERFVDERDYRLKKGTGIILLDSLICQGTVDYGRCDRACFYFWREEWLEKTSE